MTSPLRHVFWLMVGLGGWFFLPALQAQPSVPALPHAAGATPQTPPFPTMKSPVDSFRDLLAMKPEDRERELAGRPLEIRKRILAKLDEYEAMKPGDRELRLQITQLRWYMLRLVQMPPGARAPQLANLSAADQKSISDRLQKWDLLSADEQGKILKYEETMEQLEGQSLDAAAATNKVLAAVPTPARENALKNLDNFLQLPPEQRELMSASFQKFFELTDDERQKTIAALPPDEQLHLADALRLFQRLPKEERDQCLKALKKFATMSDTERREFLKNAQRWQELPPAERQAWRALINGSPPMPPLPPGFGYPPLPPIHLPLQVNLPVSTNSPP
jgi:hypothetical protein